MREHDMIKKSIGNPSSVKHLQEKVSFNSLLTRLFYKYYGTICTEKVERMEQEIVWESTSYDKKLFFPRGIRFVIVLKDRERKVIKTYKLWGESSFSSSFHVNSEIINYKPELQHAWFFYGNGYYMDHHSFHGTDEIENGYKYVTEWPLEKVLIITDRNLRLVSTFFRSEFEIGFNLRIQKDVGVVSRNLHDLERYSYYDRIINLKTRQAIDLSFGVIDRLYDYVVPNCEWH